MTNKEAIAWLNNLITSIGEPQHSSLWHYEKVLSEIKDMLGVLPSAEPEIVRCKDCKNSEHWYRDRRRCFLWSEDGVSVFDDGFCSYAERRTDG